MKRVIITGATGVLGTALTENLTAKGIEVLILCRDQSAHNDQIATNPLVKRVSCALEQLADLQNPREERYDAFFHFAWAGSVGSGRKDARLQEANIRYSLDAVGVAARFHCSVFVGAGSQAEYGDTDETLTAETPCFPQTGYGIAKLCAGQLTRVHAQQLGLRHIWPRILSVYGPNDNQQSVLPMTLAALLSGRVPALTAGEQLWDYLYSGDAAEALALLSEKGIDGKVYPLGSGTAYPLRDYLKKLRDVAAPDAELPFGSIDYAPHQRMRLCADIRDLRTDTGFLPRISFEDGIRETIRRWRPPRPNGSV